MKTFSWLDNKSWIDPIRSVSFHFDNFSDIYSSLENEYTLKEIKSNYCFIEMKKYFWNKFDNIKLFKK